MNSPTQPVTLGITRLLESERGIVEGARIGLIANWASVDEKGTPTAQLLIDAGIRVTCLFAPEHGYNAAAAPGVDIPDVTDPVTGLPVRSLYGEMREPSGDTLRDVDALVFDLQDVGARCYTYIWTMALAMRSAALFGKLFVVLDRPNPAGGVIVQGPILDPRFESFMGLYPIPLRHGMTVGELALLFNRHFRIGVNLAVIRMTGWRRRLMFAETGLTWRPPSPAIRSSETAIVYSGTCLFEGANISEGRGTSSPFRLIGAPWLDPDILNEIDGQWFEGFALSPRSFTPTDSKYAGTECAGLAIDIVDRETADPIALSVALISEIAARHYDDFTWNEAHFDALTGSDALRQDICQGLGAPGRNIEQIVGGWDDPNREFETLRQQYLLYVG